jgi:hypothetical protein
MMAYLEVDDDADDDDDDNYDRLISYKAIVGY